MVQMRCLRLLSLNNHGNTMYSISHRIPRTMVPRRLESGTGWVIVTSKSRSLAGMFSELILYLIPIALPVKAGLTTNHVQSHGKTTYSTSISMLFVKCGSVGDTSLNVVTFSTLILAQLLELVLIMNIAGSWGSARISPPAL